MKHTYLFIMMSVLAAGAVSCNKSEIEEEKSNDISFEVFTGVAANSEEATKGERYNSETDFKTDDTFGLYAWNSSVSDTEVYKNEAVSKKGDKWIPATSKKWEDRDEYVFEAVFPQPSDATVTAGLTAFTPSTNPANLTFSYKVPTTTMVSSDKDFMLAYYSGKGNEGKAPLTFTHPLTCVNFNIGTVSGISTINSITVEGVYESGDGAVRLATYGTNNRQCYSYEADDTQHTSLWTNRTGNISVKGTKSITLSSLDEDELKEIWAYNFLLIPQDTATQNVVIKINVTDDNNQTYNIKTMINSGYWRAGHTNTYKINYDASNLTLTLVAEDYNGGSWYTHGSDANTGQFTGENW